jgi:hypothetical protein
MTFFLLLVPPALFFLLWRFRSPKLRLAVLLVLAALFAFEVTAVNEAPRIAPEIAYERNPQTSTEVAEGQEEVGLIIHEGLERFLPSLCSSFFSLAAIALLTFKPNAKKGK